MIHPFAPLKCGRRDAANRNKSDACGATAYSEHRATSHKFNNLHRRDDRRNYP
jgi:hypothetical protein